MKDVMGGPGERDDLLVSLPPLMIIAGTLATRGGNRFIFGPYRMTVHQFAMLQHVAGTPCKMAELKQVMFNSAANVTQHVDALEERGWVRRVPSPDDRRVILIELTDKGRQQLEAVERHYLQQMRQYMKDFDTGQLEQVAGFLKEFIGNVAGQIDRQDEVDRAKSPGQKEG